MKEGDYMLNLWFTKPIENEYIGKKDTWFPLIFQKEWMNDQIMIDVCDMVRHHKYLGDGAWRNEKGFICGPDKLPGTLKTLIMMWNMPDEIFPIVYVGPIANHALKLITDQKDIDISHGSIFAFTWDPEQMVRLMEVDGQPIINVNEMYEYLYDLGRVKDMYTDVIWNFTRGGMKDYEQTYLKHTIH